ncbi:MAG TPA: hypothetical protein VMS22_05790 [Candidatus Eisenbacteria bacterium]|nr:hypothetical protein [Candidatus Eisenbacteria bacterium]
MRDALRLVLVGGLVGALCAPAPAALLCKKRSGVLVVREACKKKEALLDLSQLGVLGPQGDPGPAGPPEWERPCPPDSVAVGTACIDKYEASVWSVPADNTTLVAALRAGTASREDLGAGGATQIGAGCATFFPETFPVTGNWTVPLYAASVPGPPTSCVGWFQAAQACALAGKRLATNEEWQRATAGTPDGAPCVVSAGSPGDTGTVGCVSTWGAQDMVGNLNEWVAEWGEVAAGCGTWPSMFGNDFSCVGGTGANHLPAMLARGGGWSDGSLAGDFTVLSILPSDSGDGLGFRCAR